jgi:hypothetical protein
MGDMGDMYKAWNAAKKAGELVELAQCCGRPPEVFEARPGYWCVHCTECWDGTTPRKCTREEAIAEWNAMKEVE